MIVLTWLLLVLFVLVCVVICFLVLIQSDKGGGISGAIGGGLGGANSLLGTQDTANILTRGTVIFGSVFFVLCVIMSLLMSRTHVTADKSLLQKRAEKQQSYSPSSVLDQGGGLPIKQASEPAAQSPGLPIAASPAASPAPEKAAPAAPSTKTLPVGSIPIGKPPAQGGEKK